MGCSIWSWASVPSLGLHVPCPSSPWMWTCVKGVRPPPQYFLSLAPPPPWQVWMGPVCSHLVYSGILQLRKQAIRSSCRTCGLVTLPRISVKSGWQLGPLHLPGFVLWSSTMKGRGSGFYNPYSSLSQRAAEPRLWGCQQGTSSPIFGVVSPWWSSYTMSRNSAAPGWGWGGVH